MSSARSIAGSAAARVLIVPGLAVRAYIKPAAQALVAHGHDVHLLRPPTWRGAPTDVRRYGDVLARDIMAERRPIDLLVGLSIGTQAATWAAARTPLVRNLLLVSPTVDPRNRTVPALMQAWLTGDNQGAQLGQQLVDWSHAGLDRIAAGFASCLNDAIEATLPRVPGTVTVVHAEHDNLGSEVWARRLAADAGARYISLKGAPHSWPIDDVENFADLVAELTR